MRFILTSLALERQEQSPQLRMKRLARGVRGERGLAQPGRVSDPEDCFCPCYGERSSGVGRARGKSGLVWGCLGHLTVVDFVRLACALAHL